MKIGDKIKLAKQEVEVVACESCDALMVNIDQKALAKGDIDILKKAGVRISNPATDDPVCIRCEIQREEEEHTIKRHVDDYMERKDDDSDSDSSDSGFFGGGGDSGGGSFGGGFGGFGGGVFSGGGATGSW